ncbi:MAG: hypothetical protein MUC87_07940 [Bacteroidia bacterium]|nr:hypothetical protein [Bacteroidia bacterium]
MRYPFFIKFRTIGQVITLIKPRMVSSNLRCSSSSERRRRPGLFKSSSSWANR